MYCVNPECPDVEATGQPGEYTDGVWQCPYCGEDLVRSPEVAVEAPSAPRSGGCCSEEPEPVVELSDPAELEIVKSILEGAGIPYAVEGHERFSAFSGGSTAMRYLPAAGKVTVLVPARHAEEARALLTETEPEAP